MPKLLSAYGKRSMSSFPQYLLNAPPTTVTTLDSGLRVASEEIYGETISLGVWVNAGSRVENAKNNGAAHFLEHLRFKGTNKRTKDQLEVCLSYICLARSLFILPNIQMKCVTIHQIMMHICYLFLGTN